MRKSLIPYSIAVIVALLPATLFAQTAPTMPVTGDPVAPYTVTKISAKTAKAIAAKRAAAKKAAARKAAARKAAAKKAAAAKLAAAVAAAAEPTATRITVPQATVEAAPSDLETAQAVLASLKAKYNFLDDVTVEVGTTPGGYQAVSYYTKGRIILSPTHTASVERIMKHEIWHIIDWRDNGKIDWRESIPPSNAADYLK